MRVEAMGQVGHTGIGDSQDRLRAGTSVEGQTA